MDDSLTYTVTKKGHADWGDLVGETFELLFYPGWEPPEWVLITLAEISRTENEFGSPMYYLLEGDGGGYGFWESDNVEVRFV